MSDTTIIPMTDDSRIGEARRFIRNRASHLQFDADDVERAAIVISEAASNLLKHAKQGKLIISTLPDKTLEILAVDNGPGIANVAQVMQDGYSTAKSKGIGLGAIARLSSSFHIYSVLGIGTALLIRLRSKSKTDELKNMEIAVVAAPKPMEKVNGDAWSVVYRHQKAFLLVVDGLGHGTEAAEVAQRAVETFDKVSANSPVEYIQAINADLKHTRGAAVAVAEVNFTEQHVCFAGIGNINCVLTSPSKRQSMVSLPGIVGQQIHLLQEFIYSWSNLVDPLLIMHSDGMESGWNLDDYAGLDTAPVSLIAGMLFIKHTHSYDDVTVLVSRLRQP